MRHVEDARRRRDEKLRATRRKQSVTLIAALGSITLLLILGYYLINSDFWLVKTISVSGNERVSAKQIVLTSGVDYKTNLLKLEAEEIKAKLKKNPWIADTKLVRRLPNRLEIAITERRPFMGVKQAERIYILDRSGFVIQALSGPTTDTLPIVNELRIPKLAAGGYSRSRLLKGTLDSLQELDADLRAKVIWISVPSLEKLAFHTADDLEIIFGPSADAKKKNFIIKQILNQTQGKVIHINVTAPSNPVVRKVKT